MRAICLVRDLFDLIKYSGLGLITFFDVIVFGGWEEACVLKYELKYSMNTVLNSQTNYRKNGVWCRIFCIILVLD